MVGKRKCLDSSISFFDGANTHTGMMLSLTCIGFLDGNAVYKSALSSSHLSFFFSILTGYEGCLSYFLFLNPQNVFSCSPCYLLCAFRSLFFYSPPHTYLSSTLRLTCCDDQILFLLCVYVHANDDDVTSIVSDSPLRSIHETFSLSIIAR